MKISAWRRQSGALCVALLLLSAGEVNAQTAPESAPARSSPASDAPDHAEWLRSFLQLRDQLHAAQLAIATTRAESEANVRAQAAGFAGKLDAIKTAMDADRQRMHTAALQAEAERERQQLELQRSHRTVLWIAVGFGGTGLLAMLFIPMVQLRTINRLAEVANARSSLPNPALLTEADPLPGGAVALSNQRLLSVIERMEKRIFELEHAAVPPLAAGTTLEMKGGNGSLPPMPAPTTNGDQAAVISVLLGKAKFLLNTNKAREAVTSYDEVLKLDPNHADALVKKGAALERLQEDTAAIECYDRAIGLNPKMTLAYLSKAGVCNRLGRYDEAMECYEQALESEEAGKAVPAYR